MRLLLQTRLRFRNSVSAARRVSTTSKPSDEGEEEEAYAALLQRCARSSGVKPGRAVHAAFVKRALWSSIFLHNHLLNVYCKCGDIAGALRLFDEMPQRNVVSWSSLIAGCVQRGRPEKGLGVFERMRRDGFGVWPNEFTLVSVLNACSMLENLSCAYQMLALVVRLGFESNVYLMNAFLTALVRHGELAEAEEFFGKCRVKDTVSWNAMIGGYLEFGHEKVWGFWCRMISEGVRADQFSFASVLTGLANCSSLGSGLQVQAQLVKCGHGDDVCVGNSLVDMYLKNQSLIEALKVFDEMPQRDVVSWTNMASGFLQCGQPARALRLVEEMRAMGVQPNKFTLATSVNACAGLVSVEEGKKAHGLRIKLGNEIDECVDNALIDMYSKCGCMVDAQRVFRKMEDRSVITWTTMIMGFAQNGHASEALEVYEEMKLENVMSNFITFVCVLYACSQGGLVNEGWKYFLSMNQEFDISPGEDHYICMVDLLGKAGQIKEAEALIMSMPFRPGPMVWQTLAVACRIHGDLETGRRAAEKAIDLDKEDPSTYVLLSNMYADSSRWDCVGQLRGLMKYRDVQKIPGCSWI